MKVEISKPVIIFFFVSIIISVILILGKSFINKYFKFQKNPRSRFYTKGNNSAPISMPTNNLNHSNSSDNITVNSQGNKNVRFFLFYCFWFLNTIWDKFWTKFFTENTTKLIYFYDIELLKSMSESSGHFISKNF